ncbi:Cell division cycle protein 16-like [Pelomyxa schiedti]|nr:Cell division cycle protein 16-like [Pelomyxa schiedti]
MHEDAQCTELLGGQSFMTTTSGDYTPNMLRSPVDPTEAAICLIRAQICEREGNVDSAVVWYKHASIHDPITAFGGMVHLLDSRMLPLVEERQFIGDVELKLSTLLPTAEFSHLATLLEAKSNKFGKECEAVLLKYASVIQATPSEIDFCVECAEWHFYHNNLLQAHAMTARLLEIDPLTCGKLAELHVAILVELSLKEELHCFVNKLSELYPKSPVSWYSSGCYLYLIGNTKACKSFLKAINIDSAYTLAWIGYGHSLVSDVDIDKAILAYRQAAKVFKGSHFPHLFMGMLYTRLNQLIQSETVLTKALSLCPVDPLVYNELGVVSFKKANYKEAISLFNECIKRWEKPLQAQLEPVFYNLAHSYRKFGDFISAAKHYHTCLTLKPNEFSTMSALALTYYYLKNFDQAILFCHTALTKRKDNFVTSLLTLCLTSAAQYPLCFEHKQD